MEYRNYVPKEQLARIQKKEDFVKYVVFNFFKKRNRFFDFIEEKNLYDDRESATTECFKEYIKPDTQDYDLIFTNNVFFDSSEYFYEGMVHGGTTSGWGRYQGSKGNLYSIISVFKYLYRNEEFLKGTRYAYFDEDDVPHELAITVAHELGHTLLQLDHTYDSPECIMGANYTESFDKKSWKLFYENIGSCTVFKKSYYWAEAGVYDFYNNGEYQKAISFADEVINNVDGISDDSLAYVMFMKVLALHAIKNYDQCYETALELVRSKIQYLDPSYQNTLHQAMERCYISMDE